MERRNEKTAEGLEDTIGKLFARYNFNAETEAMIMFEIIHNLIEYHDYAVVARQAVCWLAFNLARLGMHHETAAPPSDPFWRYLRDTLTVHDDEGRTAEQVAMGRATHREVGHA
jgi:hypothetical protein